MRLSQTSCGKITLAKTTFGVFLSNLLLLVLLVSTIIGGVSTACAEERNEYEAMVRNGSLETNLRIFADTEYEAREYLMLNGWEILSLVRRGDVNDENGKVKMKIGVEKTKIGGKLNIPGEVKAAPKKQENGTIIVPKEKGAKFVSDRPVLFTPDSDGVTYLFTVYFPLGDTQPMNKSDVMKKIEALDKAKSYYLYGHTDEVRVGKKASYRNNYELSHLRAGTIRDLFTGAGFDPEKLNAVGVGPVYAKKVMKGNVGVLKHRRVDIYGVK